jgi:RNA polymerase sigma-70 factor (ECF subfamily)
MTADIAPVFDEHRAFLWAVSYRLTGNAADADDIVQETFVRALTRPPADRDRPWRPWLVRVAVNLGRDLLRRRRRRGGYHYSARETAAALGLSEANARATHLRARRALAGYEARRRPITAERQRVERAALEKFLACVTKGDIAGVEAMLARDARALSDSAGEFHSNRVPVIGRVKVAALLVGVVKGLGRLRRVEVRILNGQAAVTAQREPKPGFGPRWVTQFEFDDHGQITGVYTVLATRKLTAIA